MSFLQPFVLVAIAAAAIPLLLHLLTLRRLPVVPFSTLSFLKELQRSRVRAVRLKQLLLLLLRTMLVVLLVLAFARPTLTGVASPGLGGTTTTDAIILIDDSYSMSRRDENGAYVRQAEEAARVLLSGLTADDRAIVLPFSGLRPDDGAIDASWRVPSAPDAPSPSVSLSARHIPLPDALRHAAALFATRTAVNKEVYIVSDLQRGLVTPVSSDATRFDERVTLTFVRVGETREENMSFTSVQLGSTILDAGIPVTFDLRVRNYMSSSPRTANVSMFLHAQRLDQRVRTIPSTEEVSLELQGIPHEPGYQEGSLVLEGDETEFDNTYWFVLRIPRERKVLLVGSDQEMFHAGLALSASPAGATSGFRVTHVRPGQLTSTLLREHDVYVMSDGALSGDLASTLKEQVGNGKGIILVPSGEPRAPGSTGAADVFSAAYGEQTGGGSGDRVLTFGRTDDRHPIFSGMFAPSQETGPDQAARIESPDIFSARRLRPPPGSTTIISLGHGDPFLAAWRSGSGRVLAFAVEFLPERSTFPVSGLFVPLLHRSVSYASGTSGTLLSYLAGEEITRPLPPEMATRLRLEAPDGEETPVQPTMLPTGPVFRTTAAVLPGIYTIRSDGEELERFAVNVSPLESDPDPATDEQLEGLAGAFGVGPERFFILRNDDDLGSNVSTARIGTELWPILLLLALLAALAETWLAGALRNEAAEAERS